MFDVYFYRDSKGNSPIIDYMNELKSKSDKDSRIKLNKINDYIEMLHQYGTSAGQPYVKHLEDNIWELRPLRDRILFVAWTDGGYVLLHHFMKKTQKTPRKEIRKAKQEYLELIKGSGLNG